MHRRRSSMLNFLARRIAQLIPTLFFVSILIFSLQQLLPGDPALVMAGEERDPAVIEQIRHQYRLDQPIPVQYVYWVKGVLSGDFGESLAHQGAGARADRAEAAGDAAARLDGDRDRLPDRHSRRHHLRGEEEHRLGLWRQHLRAVGHLDAELLARHHADLPVLDQARLAAGIGIRAARRELAREPRLHHHAGLRARQRHRSGPDAPYPQRDAAGAGRATMSARRAPRACPSAR